MAIDEIIVFTHVRRRLWDALIWDHHLAASQRLARRYRDLDGHWLEDAAEDALMEHMDRPDRYDAATGVPLSCYLY